MTLKEFIDRVMETATVFLKRGDHENYQRCMTIIASAIAEKYA